MREGEHRGSRIAQEAQLQLITLVSEALEAKGRVRPTLDGIVLRAVERGIVEQISCSHVQRSCRLATCARTGSSSGYTVRTRRFARRVSVICRLYRKPPGNAVVLSIDGKTGIQA
ncbi:IS630 family transposase, partial [Paraburkholderia humisilvae]